MDHAFFIVQFIVWLVLLYSFITYLNIIWVYYLQHEVTHETYNHKQIFSISSVSEELNYEKEAKKYYTFVFLNWIL